MLQIVRDSWTMPAALALACLAGGACSGRQAPSIPSPPDSALDEARAMIEQEQAATQPAAVAAPVVPTGSPAPPASPAPTLDDPDRYRVGPGDLLLIEVFNLEELDRRVRVLGDGTISMPLLGNFRISGLTLPEAEATISGMLRERSLVTEPQVSVFVEEYVSLAVYVQGAVEKPGVYQLLGKRTLIDMLGEAGGLLGKASESAGETIFVLRHDASGVQRRIEIDAERLVGQGDMSLNMLLQPGDVIMVPHEKRLTVYVNGAVNDPGPVEFLSGDGITVLQAITAAGGTTERANLGKVFINRKTVDGTISRVQVDLKKIKRGRQEDVVLEKNDIVVVTEWFL